jgi:hypothetical protein
MNPVVPRNKLPEQIENLVDRLATVYHDQVSHPTIETVVRNCYGPLAEAKIPHYVANLVEHASRDQLRQLVAS